MHKAACKALFDRQAGFAPALLVERGWEVFTSEFPTLDVLFTSAGRVPLRVKMGCADWNELPPSIGSWTGTEIICWPYRAIPLAFSTPLCTPASADHSSDRKSVV